MPRPRLMGALCALSALLTLPATAAANIPDCDASSATGAGTYAICAHGDADTVVISITLQDAFSNPIVRFPADSICLDCPSADGGTQDDLCAEAPTDLFGQTEIRFSGGGYSGYGFCDDVGVRIHKGVYSCVLDVASRSGVTVKFFNFSGGHP